MPLATDSLTAYRLVEDRVRGSLQCGNLARLKSARGQSRKTKTTHGFTRCLLHPESGQIPDRAGMSALCQKATFAAQQNYCSITSSDTGINVRATSWS